MGRRISAPTVGAVNPGGSRTVTILVHIHSYRQLNRLRAAALDTTVEGVKGLVAHAGGTCLVDDRGTMVFGVDANEGDADFHANLLFAVHDCLLDHKNDLQGFTVVADDCDDSVSLLPQEVGRLRRMSVTAPQRESVWLGEKLRYLLASRVECDGEHDFSSITARRDALPQSSADINVFLRRARVIERLDEYLRGLPRGSREVRWLALVAAADTWLAPSVRGALDSLVGNRRSRVEWIWIRANNASQNPFEIFLDAIPAGLYLVATEFLSKTERLLWDQRKGVFRFDCADHAAEDFFAAYSLLLLAYARQLRRRQLPPIIVCEDADKLSAESLETLGRLLRRLNGHAQLTVLCTLEDPERLSPLSDIAHGGMDFGGLDAEEIAERLRNAELAGEIPAEMLASECRGRGFAAFHTIRRRSARGAGRPAAEMAALIASPETRTGTNGAGNPHIPTAINAESHAGAVLASALESAGQGGRKVLYVAALSRGFFGRPETSDFMGTQGLGEEAFKREVLSLSRLGLLDGEGWRVRFPAVEERLRSEFAQENISATLSDFATAAWRKRPVGAERPEVGKPGRAAALFAFLSRSGRFEHALELFYSLMTGLMDAGNTAQALHHLEHEDLFRMPMDPTQMRRRDFALGLLSLRAAVLLESQEQADLKMTELKEAPAESEGESGRLELVAAQHLYASGEHRQALTSAKHALISSQASGLPDLECKADIEIGLNMLAGARCEEAEEYFSIAQTAVSDGDGSYDRMRALTFEGLSLYMFGNLSKALIRFEQARAMAAEICRREWQRYALFLKGRCLYALGLYREAAKIFKSGSSFSKIYHHRDAEGVFEAWRLRASAESDPLGVLRAFETLPQNAENLFFVAEICSRTGNAERAVDLLESSLSQQRELARGYTPAENVPWSNGFAAVEDRALRSADGQGMLHNLARALRAYAMGQLHDVAEGIAELQRMTREDRLSSEDPYLSTYFYYHSTVIPSGEGELHVNKLTALSKALKHVQQRATRIDDVKLRQSFLRANRINALLLDDAKRFKLM